MITIVVILSCTLSHTQTQTWDKIGFPYGSGVEDMFLRLRAHLKAGVGGKSLSLSFRESLDVALAMARAPNEAARLELLSILDMALSEVNHFALFGHGGVGLGFPCCTSAPCVQGNGSICCLYSCYDSHLLCVP